MIAARRPAPGAPVVPHSRPLLGPEEQAAAARVIGSGRLAPGPEAARCEALVARLSECADALAVSSGTTALALALRALGLGANDDVAIPSYACEALLHAVRAAGARPLICDIEPAGLALDPADLERRDGARLRAAIVVHPFGMPARLEPFRARGLLVVEDGAQAPGALDRGRPVGARGDAAIFSFGPTKAVTCGGPGGALASPRASLVATARDLARHDEHATDRPRVNGLMGDLHAAIAAVQIGRLREFAARRAEVAARYDRAFAGLGFERPAAPEGTRPIVYRYLLRLRTGADALLQRLNARGIVARRPVFLPLHRLAGSAGRFPESDAAHAELISLPLYPALEEGEIERVIEEVSRCRP